MKSDSLSVFLKGLGFVGAALALQYSQALGQWSNSGEWPSDLQWHMIIATTVGAGFNALVAFMSGSYTTWRQGKSPRNGLTETPPEPKVGP